MMKTRWLDAGLPLSAVGLALTLSACSGDIPSSPNEAAPPSHAFQDALNGEGGNPFVFLKPPVVDEPASSAFGTFDPDLHPIVEICDKANLDSETGLCTTLLPTIDGTGSASYTVDGGPGGEAITVDLTAEEYQLQIHFSLFDLQGSEYRILTRIGSRILAFADLILISPNEMKNPDTENNIVFTNDQKTVPWKFRIDHGALCWEEGETKAMVTCSTSSTVTAGEEETVTLTSSDGEEVDLHLPAGWTATVNDEPVSELTISIDELPTRTLDGDVTCFNQFFLSDPTTGEPSNCYDVRADTETESDVTVVFGTYLPILAFCPDREVLQAVANDVDGYIMTSVQDDTQGAVRRTYTNVAPAADFGGCTLPPAQISFGDGAVGQFAGMVWQRVRPVLKPLLPKPLYAVDIGFGGELRTLSTIFFWGRTPEAITVTPSSTSVDEGQTVQLSAVPLYHDGAITGSPVAVQWSSNDNAIATVDGSGLVTGVEPGTAVITATATDVEDIFGVLLTADANVTVEAAAIPGGFGTATINGESAQGEWDNAACFPVTMNLPSGNTSSGEFCFMNDQTNLYVRSTYTNTDDTSDPASTLFFDMDMDGDGNVAADPGDDRIGHQQGNGAATFEDFAWYDDQTFTGVSCSGSRCFTTDPNLGGIIDGEGAYGNANSVVTFELSHPLASGDETGAGEPLDVAWLQGDVVWVRFHQTISQDTQGTVRVSTVHIQELQIQ